MLLVLLPRAGAFAAARGGEDVRVAILATLFVDHTSHRDLRSACRGPSATPLGHAAGMFFAFAVLSGALMVLDWASVLAGKRTVECWAKPLVMVAMVRLARARPPRGAR